jgi:DNA-binding response OmpR family regulator
MAKIRSVCIVDDSAGMRSFGAKVLTNDGIEVFTAVDGYDALNVIRENTPDACFIDIEMPNIDGLQLVSMLRAWDGWDKKPIAMLSSASSPFDMEKGLLFGVDIYLTKPFTAETIQKALQDLENILEQ